MIAWPRRRARVPDGVRVYAVAPLGGRIAALDAALAGIAADDAARPAATRHILLLGGIADGPDAPALALRAMKLVDGGHVALLRGPDEDRLLAGGAGGWPTPEDVPATVLHWLARRPAEGWIGDYRFGDGQVTAHGRALTGAVIGLEGRERWVVAA